VEFGNPKFHFRVIEEYGSRIHVSFLFVVLIFILIFDKSSMFEEADFIVIVSFHESLHSGS
jgi:hypothetical protein